MSLETKKETEKEKEIEKKQEKEIVKETKKENEKEKEKEKEEKKETDEKLKKPTSKDYYFDSYSHYSIHEEMLQDQIRTGSYCRAILKNKALFKDKIVMDVGCGTGILSMFAAKAGAKRVIGIECSGIIEQARQIVKENGYSDIIKLVHKKCEDIVELPDGIEKVDIIISEWMGYCLFYESMLNTVIYARDRWLKKGGKIMPNKSSLFISGCIDQDFITDKISFWNNVWGFKMNCIKKLIYLEPLVDIIDQSSIVTNSSILKSIDLNTITVEDLSFNVPFELTSKYTDNINAFVTYFTYTFDDCDEIVFVSTSPNSPETHWKQSIFYLQKPFRVQKLETITGNFLMKPNENNERDFDITIDYKVDGKYAKIESSQDYRLR
ncbi:arginine methyltransferase 1-related [Anaeramoeba flamelloides]|uniref:Arginine methyltransferase 1-related n=1 Tax=Anaeramoeba flamelloides TaxID=1746091 RepID=A0ABQ8Z5X1_9EUKA|nr:arginine methyltransferase 1-related [Anaeramoeba flamelloides]